MIGYSARGGMTAVSLKDKLDHLGFESEIYLYEKYFYEKYCGDGGCESSNGEVSACKDSAVKAGCGIRPFRDAGPLVEEAFRMGTALIFFCAAGIAVRKIAPYIRSKQTDPAVLVADECGRFVIPILSGHIGGANELAEICASLLGGTAVITTATDVHGKLAPDVFAVQNDLYIESIHEAKEIAAALLADKKVGLFLEAPFVQMPVVPADLWTEESIVCYGIQVTPYRVAKRYEHTLHLVPKILTLGIGCRKGTPKERIAQAVDEVLEENGLHRRAVRQVCSIDLKKDEEGILSFCKERGLPFRTFSSEELAAVSGDFSASAFVRQITGVDNVCERSALCGSKGELLIKKTVCDGVTVAAAAETICLHAGEDDMETCRVLLFGGTTEGRELAVHLNRERIPSVVCVATGYGEDVLPELPYCRILQGRLNQEEMQSLMEKEKPVLVLDATHPYAAEVTGNIRKASENTGTSYLRIVRGADKRVPGAEYFRTLSELTAYVNTHPGHVFVTTGSKELEQFVKIENYRERLFVRVLPSEKVLEKCRGLGFEGEHLIGAQGPFSVEENLDALRRCKARYFVTKSTGSTGGFPEKAEAAKLAGATLLILERPVDEEGMTLEEARSYLTEKRESLS